MTTWAPAALGIAEARPQDSWLGSSLVVAVGVTVLMTNFLMPTLVGVYVDSYGLSVRDAGYTAAAYMTGAGAGAALVSWLLLSVRTPVLATISLSALALGNLASIRTHSLEMILAIRLIAGVGEGAGFALMGAGVSRMRNPNRAYGVFVVLVLVVAAGTEYCVPWLRSMLGGQMLFVPIAVAPASLLLFIRKFPDLAMNDQPAGVATSPFGVDPATSALQFWSGTLATLTAYIAYGAGFAYIERIGVSAGLSADAVASVLGTGYLLSVGGALASILTANLGRRSWKISAALLTVAGATVLAVAGQALAYRIGVTALFFAWYYFAPNLLALMSLADRSGRLAAAVTGAMEWGLAIGPTVAALWVGQGSFTVLAVMAACGFLIAIALLAPVLRHVAMRDRSRLERAPSEFTD